MEVQHRETERELYNLDEDSRQAKNLIDQEKAKAKEFEAIIRGHTLWEEKLQKQKTIVYEKERIRRRINRLKSLGKI